MKVINIADEKQRNSRVALDTKKRAQFTHKVDPQLQTVESVRIVKGSLETDFASLTRTTSPEELSKKLIEGDPEIDVELFGKRIDGTVRIYLNSDNQPAGAVHLKERVFSAAGEMTEERTLRDVEANINNEAPLKWTGRLMAKSDCVKKFAFTNAYQIKHVDGLTFDFLYNMAKELEDKQSLLFLGAGKKSNEPLILSRNGKQYRAFLEGRTRGNAYQLIMHLTNLELKPVRKSDLSTSEQTTENN
jgi:hypothetical protein